MKKNTHKIKFLLLSLGCIMYINTSLAQSSITIDASQVISSFTFTDSEGTQDKDYSVSYSGAYSLGYQYTTDFGLMIRPNIGMRKGGATLVYDGINYQWSLQYANIKAGIGYMYEIDKLAPYICISPYFGYLLKANQRINNEDFDIIDSGSIKKIDYGVIGSLGAQFRASDVIAVYSDFSYMMGLANIETDLNGQKTTNIGYILTLGLSFTIQ